MTSAKPALSSPPHVPGPAEPPPAAAGSLLVFATELLPPSHTFVRDHVENVGALPTVMLGVHRVSGLSLDHLSTETLPKSRIARLILWFTGISPALDRIVRNHGIVAIHAHFADAGMKIARYAKRRRLPLIVTLHGADVLRIRRQGLGKRLATAYLRRGMMDWTRLFLPVSDHIRNAALADGYPAERLRKHVLGVPLPDDQAPSRAKAGRAAPIILFVGRFVEKKGLSFLLSACDQLADRGVNFTLRIAGDGPLRTELREQAGSLGDRVEFLGLLKPEAVQEQLAQADIFCMPSTRAADGDNEGLPIVCLEAQAAGLPVVAFRQGPVPEGIEDGITGILAPDKSAPGLADALEVLLGDPSLREQFGASGRRLVHERFDIRDRSRELDRIYESILSGAN